MEIMDKMPELIAEEARDAMKYANMALAYRDTNPALAEMFMKLSADELAHMRMITEKLGGMVEKLHGQYNEG